MKGDHRILVETDLVSCLMMNVPEIPADVDFENGESFGLYLIKLLVEQLDGTVDLGRDGGTTFRIRFRGGRGVRGER